MQITSTNFQNLEPIPIKYTAYGENINPALTFSQIPEDAQSLALIVEDPDGPQGLFVHWILFNMSPATLQITERELPISGTLGVNDMDQKDYFGPQPSPNSGTHHYFFKLYALDEILDVPDGIPASTLKNALENHVIETAEIIGVFSATGFPQDS